MMVVRGMLLLLFFMTATNLSSQVNLVVERSQTSGVAPLYVFFDATGSSGLTGENDLVNADFTWDFDATNTNPTGQWEKMKGMVAGHVFDLPGVYTISCTVKAPDGSMDTEDVVVTVNAFNGSTYYVSNAGDDSNDGLTEATAWQTASHAFGQLTTGQQLLFRRGDVFQDVNFNFQNFNGNKTIIGAYGQGARPILNGMANDARVFDVRFSNDIVFEGIHVIVNAPGVVSYNFHVRDSEDILLNEVEIEGANGISILNLDCNLFCVANSEFHDFGVMATYAGDGTRLSWIGNTVQNMDGSAQPEHAIRVQGGEKQFFAYNDIFNLTETKTSITIRGDGQRHVMLYRNKVDRIIGVNPTNVSTVQAISDVTIEGNYIGQNQDYTGTGWENSLNGINIEATNVAVRNNVIDGYHNGVGVSHDYNGVISGMVDVYHNTYNWRPVGPISSNSGRLVRVRDVDNVNVANNFLTGPSASDVIPVAYVGNNTDIVESNNVSSTIADYLVNPLPESAADVNDISNYQLNPASLAHNSGSGSVPVFEDVLHNQRSLQSPDVGLFEYGVTSEEDTLPYSDVYGMSDEFEAPCHLYHWKDISDYEGWNANHLESKDVQLSNQGKLTMMPYTTAWYANYRSTLLYKEMAGDFVFTTQVDATNRAGNDIPSRNYSLAGIMIRTPKDTLAAQSWSPGQENYVFLSLGLAATNHPTCLGCPGPHFEVKSTTNSNSTLSVSSIDTANATIRLIRQNDAIIVLYKLPGDDFVVHRRYLRADMPDTVQIGFVTYTDWPNVQGMPASYHNANNHTGSGFNPDLIGTFEYGRVNTVALPQWLENANFHLSNDVPNDTILTYFGYETSYTGRVGWKTWLGTTSSDWNDATNWLDQQVPSSNDSIFIPDCSCPEVFFPVVSTHEECQSLVLEKGSTLTIAAQGHLDVSLETDNALFNNHGLIDNSGQLFIIKSTSNEVQNVGTILNQTGGEMRVMDNKP